MRRLILVPVLATLAACAPRYAPAPVSPAPVAAATLAGGPEGESAPPEATAVETRPEKAPSLSAIEAPSARMAAAMERLREKHLVIPVAGVSSSAIEDSFNAGRDDGERRHHAVDILAPRNTPVIAADDGVILRMSSNSLGGITIYAVDRRKEFVYYYAHLDHYQRGVRAGQAIQKGDTLGYVGTTGNAPENIPHLHFQVMLWPSDGKYWYGEPVNPYPVLHPGGASGGARLRFD